MGQNPNEFPKEVKSFQEALGYLLSTDFKFTDSRSETIQSLTEKKGATLVSAHYYSFDRKVGFAEFIFLPGNTFIYEKIPKAIWDEYRKCALPNSYYETNILNKYKCAFKQLRDDGTQYAQ